MYGNNNMKNSCVFWILIPLATAMQASTSRHLASEYSVSSLEARCLTQMSASEAETIIRPNSESMTTLPITADMPKRLFDSRCREIDCLPIGHIENTCETPIGSRLIKTTHTKAPEEGTPKLTHSYVNLSEELRLNVLATNRIEDSLLSRLKPYVSFNTDFSHLVFRKLQKRVIDNDTHKMRKLYECISDEVVIGTMSGDREVYPIITALTDEKAVVIWASGENPTTLIGQMLDMNLNKIGSQFQITSGSISLITVQPESELLQNGHYAVVWVSSSSDIYLRIMNEDLQEGPEIQINDSTDGRSIQPDICFLADGRLIIVWQYNSSISKHIYGKLFDISGSAIGSEFEIYRNDFSSNFPKCTALSDGNFIVTWVASDGDQYTILAQMFNSSANPMDDEFVVNTMTSGIQEDPHIDTLNDGKFVIAWEGINQNPSSFDIFAQIFDSLAQPVGNELQVAAGTDSMVTARVSAMHDGGFLVTWVLKSAESDYYDIYGQRFNENGGKIDSELLLNVEKTGTEDDRRSVGLYNGFIVVWFNENLADSQKEIIGRAYYDTNVVSNGSSCQSCLSNEYVNSNSCQSCRSECASCDDAINCTECIDLAASTPDCCSSNRNYSGTNCSIAPTNQYFSGTECVDCDEKCATCDSLGCLSCTVTGIDCCGPFRTLQSDEVSCGCSSECATCDSTGCLTCSSGESCCPSSRYFDSSLAACLDCATSDVSGCLLCTSGVTTCCPEGRFYNDATLTCEDCESPCATCTSTTDCVTCESGTTCCIEGQFLDGTCADCLSDCATCSNATSCDICRDPNATPPECCTDNDQDDANQDGFCECLDGTTEYSGCTCPQGYIWYWANSQFLCYGPFNITPLTLEGSSDIGLSCTEDIEILVTDFSQLKSDNVNTIEFRWFSDSSSLSALLRSQISNPLSISSASLPEGTTTFTVYMSVYGVIFTGTHSITKSADSDLSISTSHGPIVTLSTEESLIVTAIVSSQPCPSVIFNWANTNSVRRLQLPTSSSNSLVIPSNTLPSGVHIYTVTATSGSASFTNTIIFVVSSPDLFAVIDSIGPNVPSTDDLTLNGSNSYDSAGSTGSLSYFWSCAATDTETCPSFSVSSDSQLTISNSELTQGMSFAITLTVNKDKRTDSTSVFLIVN